jgi:hypothetical protein
MINRKEAQPAIYTGKPHRGFNTKYPEVLDGARGWIVQHESWQRFKDGKTTVFYPRAWGGIYCFQVNDSEWRHDDEPPRKGGRKKKV